MATLEETIDAAIGQGACKEGMDRISGGKTAQELYDGVAGDEAGMAHWWLILVAITNNAKAKETLVACVQDVATHLPDGALKDQINTLAHDDDTAALRVATAYVAERKKAGERSPLLNAYGNAAQWLLDGAASPLFVGGVCDQLMAQRIKVDGLALDAAKQETYDFLRTQVSFADFNPGGLA
jgi:hypothetical protein